MRTEKTTLKIFINRKKYEIDEPEQTGLALKQLAGIPPGDVLFLQTDGDDEVVPNDVVITLHDKDRLHSQPPADYGLGQTQLLEAGLDPAQTEVVPQPGGWTFLVVREFELPDGYRPERADVLIKLPPLFPEAAPDMFWVRPAVRTSAGGSPRSTTTERLLGEPWQRFSWHISPGGWKPGESSLRDFLRCVRARFVRRD